MIKDYIEVVPDWPQPGVIFRDITPLLLNPEAFRYTIESFVYMANELAPKAIVGIESRGFLLASAVAHEMNLPLIIARKPGKLPRKTVSASYDLEYGSSEIHVHADIPRTTSFVIDDVLATGGTARATASALIEAGSEVIGFGFLIELTSFNGRQVLHNVDSLVKF